MINNIWTREDRSEASRLLTKIMNEGAPWKTGIEITDMIRFFQRHKVIGDVTIELIRDDGSTTKINYTV